MGIEPISPDVNRDSTALKAAGSTRRLGGFTADTGASWAIVAPPSETAHVVTDSANETAAHWPRDSTPQERAQHPKLPENRSHLINDTSLARDRITAACTRSRRPMPQGARIVRISQRARALPNKEAAGRPARFHGFIRPFGTEPEGRGWSRFACLQLIGLRD